MTQNLLTTAQVAERLGKSRRTVHRMAADGRLPHVTKIGGGPGTGTGAWLFDETVVDMVRRTLEQNQPVAS